MFGWISPNECRECQLGCSLCQDASLKCIVQLDFTVTEARSSDNVTSDLNFILNLFNNPKSQGPARRVLPERVEVTSSSVVNMSDPFNLNPIIGKPLSPKTLKLLLSSQVQSNTSTRIIQDTEVNSQLSWNQQNELELSVTLPPNTPSGNIAFTAHPQDYLVDPSSSDVLYQLSNQTYTVKSNYDQSNKITEAQAADAKKMGGTAGSVMSGTASAMEYLSLLSSIFMFDPTGLIMKFSQIIKMTSRLRMINVEFGPFLTLFLDNIGIMFDKPTKLSNNEIVEMQNGSKGKFDKKKASLLLTEPAISLKPFIYLGSWGLHLLFFVLLSICEKFNRLSVMLLRVIRTHRQLHFVVMNMTIVDVMYYGVRNLVHTNYNAGNLTILFSGLCFTAAVYDIVNIGYHCAKTTFSAAQEDNQDEKAVTDKKNSTDSTLDESQFQLNDNEVNKQNFNKLNRGNIGMRAFFWDSDIDKHKFITREKLLTIGYKQVISLEETIKLNRKNHVIEAYAKSELKDDPNVYSRLSTLLGNYFFLVRVMTYQFTIVSLCQNPLILVPILMVIESFYLITNIWNYSKLKHLKDFRTLLSKLTQSFSLLVFLIFSMTLAFNVGAAKQPVPISKQRTGMWCIVISMVIEYIFLIVVLVMIVKQAWTNYKKEKAIKEQQKLEMSKMTKEQIVEKQKMIERKKISEFVVFKWVRQENIDGNEKLLEFQSTEKDAKGNLVSVQKVSVGRIKKLKGLNPKINSSKMSSWSKKSENIPRFKVPKDQRVESGSTAKESIQKFDLDKERDDNRGKLEDNMGFDSIFGAQNLAMDSNKIKQASQKMSVFDLLQKEQNKKAERKKIEAIKMKQLDSNYQPSQQANQESLSQSNNTQEEGPKLKRRAKRDSSNGSVSLNSRRKKRMNSSMDKSSSLMKSQIMDSGSSEMKNSVKKEKIAKKLKKRVQIDSKPNVHMISLQ